MIHSQMGKDKAKRKGMRAVVGVCICQQLWWGNMHICVQ
jgi:hypothetical protein